MKFVTFVLAGIFVFVGVGEGKTIQVPGDYNTIQEAIDASMNGDTVLVHPGTYVENIDFKGKAITVKSEKGPELTVLDGGNPKNHDYGSVVIFQSAEGIDSILDGFTITNGSGTFCQVGSKTGYAGGGIYCNKASNPKLNNNIIKGNEVLGQSSDGGGICCRDNSSPMISDSMIYDNASDNGGGGITCYDSCDPLIINNTIYNNITINGGGGISCYKNSNPTILNNTIIENISYKWGGGVYCGQYSSPIITNTIIYNNSSLEDPEIKINSGNPVIIYSNIKGGFPGTGNINDDPLFVNSLNNDYHINYTSPCKNSGDNTAANLPIFDFEGDPRISEASVDIGADEFHRHIYYVGDSVPGGSVDVKIVGVPWTAPTWLFIGLNINDPPINSPYGDWYLVWPFIGPINLGLIPPQGVYILSGIIPTTYPNPISVYMQSLVGDKLTNLCIMNVE